MSNQKSDPWLVPAFLPRQLAALIAEKTFEKAAPHLVGAYCVEVELLVTATRERNGVHRWSAVQRILPNEADALIQSLASERESCAVSRMQIAEFAIHQSDATQH